MIRSFLGNYYRYLKFKRNSKNAKFIGFPLTLRNIKYVHVGKNVKLYKNYRIECYDSFHGQKLSPLVEIGNNCIINFNFTCLASGKVSIGENTIIASNVMITTEDHGIDPLSDLPYHAQPLISKDVSIGDGCGIGDSVKILKGVTIGEKSIIGTSSVVTKDIPPYSIAVGIPAKVIKIFNFENNCWEKV